MASEESVEEIAFDFETRSRLESLPLHSTDLLTLLDERGVIQYESPAIERLYGYDQDELVGERVADFCHPEDREAVMEAVEAVVSGETHHWEAVDYRHLMADDSYRWVESVASADPTAKGHYVVNSRDITDRIEREHDLEAVNDRTRAERDGKEAIRRLLFQAASGRTTAASSCEFLVEEYGYEGVWILRQSREESPSTETLAGAGTDEGLRTETGPADSPVDGLTERVLETGSEATVTVDGSDPLSAELAARKLAWIRSVPITYDGLVEGTLTAVGSSPPESIPRALLSEFAAAIAFKEQVHRQRQALAAEAVVELEIVVGDEHVLSALSTHPAIPDSARLLAHELDHDDGLVGYLLEPIDVDAGTLAEAIEETEGVERPETVALREGEPAIRVALDPPTFATVLGGYGGVVRSITATGGEVTLRVQFPRLTDVSRVVETVSDHWPSARMHSMGERTIERERPSVVGALTIKEERALRVATAIGFFDRPQRATAADVADVLGVSRSTALKHVRSGERAVMAEVFEADSDR